MIYAYDVDGTICEDQWPEPYAEAVPMIKIIKRLNKLYDDGNTIILYSARFEEDREVTVEWMRKHNVKYHRLILDKFRADIYVDRDSRRPDEI